MIKQQQFTFNSSYYQKKEKRKERRIQGKMELHLGGLTIKIECSHFWLAMRQKKWKNADRKEHKGRKARRKCRETYTVNVYLGW